jgi:hypothetical protein
MIQDILLEPITGSFDVAELEGRLAATRFAVRDQAVPNKFMVFDDAVSARDGIVARRRDPSTFPYDAGLIVVAPTHVQIAYRLGGIELLRDFVHWLASRYAIRYRDEEFHDVTASVDPNFDVLFGVRA